MPNSLRSQGIATVAGLWIALFGFLLSSFPAKNVDLLGRLASGRAILQKLAITETTGPTDLNHQPSHQAWLFDVAVYATYRTIGGNGLVIAKAILIGCVGIALLRLGRIGRDWWIPTVCAGLALLSMSTRLLIQPATVSILFLLLAFWLAGTRQRSADLLNDRPPFPWWLTLLFLSWANTDSWFVLGLAVVLLVWLGRLADAVRQGRATRAAALRYGLYALAVAAVCLVNPMHVKAFGIPAELESLAFGAHSEGRISSPFQRAYFDTLGTTPAGLSFFPLVGLSAISFLVNIRGWRWERFLPWLGMLLLSAWEVRTVPFFAVITGPILAWNLGEYFERRLQVQTATHSSMRLSRVLGLSVTGALGLLFLLAAWPGWLQVPPFGPRRWSLDTPRAFEQAAAAVRDWRRTGRLNPEGRGLHLAIDSARAFAWYAPDEPWLRDERLSSAFFGAPIDRAEWLQAMRAARVTHVIVYDRDRTRLFQVLDQLLADPKEWPILFMSGDLVLFGWRDVERADPIDPFHSIEIDMDQRAFHPAPAQRAPDRPTVDVGRARHWAQTFWKGATSSDDDRNEATLQVLHAEALRRTAPIRHLNAWESSQLCALVGAPSAWTAPGCLADCHIRLILFRPPLPEGKPATPPSLVSRATLALQRNFALQRDDSPPALLYAAVRAGRRAVALNPNDAQAWSILGESYLRMLHNTRERAWGQLMPELAQFRIIQASAALNRALALKPDLEQAHLNLSALYGEIGYLDLSLEHQKQYAAILRASARSSRKDQRQLTESVQDLDRQIAQRAREMQAREQKLSEAARTMRLADRAQSAVGMGMAAKARDMLLQSDVAAFGSQGMALELELLLKTGRPADVRDWTDPDLIGVLGEASYHWFRVQAFAALGDYGSANSEAKVLAVAGRDSNTADPRQALALALGRAITDVAQLGDTAPNAVRRAINWFDLRAQAVGIARTLRHEADVNTFRGLLALEQGDMAEAKLAFQQALASWQSAQAAATGAGLDFTGRPAAQTCLEWITNAPKSAQ